MATAALDYPHRRVTVEEFLEMDFGGVRAELVDGVVVMMAGGNNDHNLVAGNILGSLWTSLRGSGCRAYNSDQAVRTSPSTLRYPDASIYCGDPGAPDKGEAITLGDPKVVFEVFSQSTMEHDQRFKLEEYKALAGVDAIVMVAPATQRIRLVERIGVDAWRDRWLDAAEDVIVASAKVILPRADIFRRD